MSSNGHATPLAVAATFTAEPLEPVLRFWMDELGLGGPARFAPYNQVLQQLLDPMGDLGRNGGGVNAVLVRFEDWLRFLGPGADEAEALARGADDLAAALRSYASAPPAPLVLAVGPASPAVAVDPARAALHGRTLAGLAEAASGLAGVHWLDASPGALGLETGAEVYDPRSDRLGHIPYTPLYYAALGTALARRAHALKTPRPKVLALDCDNTLWRGVVGEDGPHGVAFPAGLLAVHEFAVRQQESGVLVCLVSKNAADDVRAVFEGRPESVLKRSHVVAERVNWLPKSENLRSLADELNLGLDSFAFLDDNPVECAEVAAACPGVLTLHLPAVEAEVPRFLDHLWPFDALAVTEEDRNRTRMYLQNAERDRFERESGGIGAFLEGLQLKVEIGPPDPDEVARVAQLTQRTNQFNATTVRRGEAEVRGLARSGLECLRVRVSDRFGDYGLVGVLILGDTAEAVEVETLLLSCRVLGRGVEHAMLAHAGRLALDRGKARVDVRFAPTARNQPAADFLRSVAEGRRDGPADGPSVYRIPAVEAAALRYTPGADARDQIGLARERPKATEATSQAPARDRSAVYQRIATELRDPSAVLRAVERAGQGARPELDTPFVAPRGETERVLAATWARLLGLDRVGALDDFAALGGTSLKAALLFADVDARFGVRLPLTTILEASTVEALATRIDGAGADPGEARGSLKLLRPGGPGPALFLVHDGHGETLLYLHLARRMPPGVAVYGVEPLGDGRCPIRHTRVADMAAYYLSEVRRVQPEGPYFLGGMCAGGTIAFEMALQLEAEGQTVGLVALLDPAAPGAVPRGGITAGRRRERFLAALKGQGGLARAAKKAGNLVVYEVTSRVKRYSDRVRFRALRRATDAGRPVPWPARGLPVMRVYGLAERGYEPLGVLRAPAVLFRATQGEGADEPFARIFADPMLGWGRWVEAGPEVCDMPGGHSSMLREPHVAAMADRIAAAFAGAEAEVEAQAAGARP